MPRWTSADEQTALEMVANDKLYSEIGEKLGRSRGSVGSHIFNTNGFLEKYHEKLMKNYEKYLMNNNNNPIVEINVSKLKVKSEVYYYKDYSSNLYHYDKISGSEFWTNPTYIGWIKCEIIDIDTVGGRIKIKYGRNRIRDWIELSKIKIKLKGDNLYYYDAYNNKISHSQQPETDFERHGGFNESLMKEFNFKCSCNKLLTKTTLGNLRTYDTMECINCKRDMTKIITDSYGCYYSSEKNDIHPAECIHCEKCVSWRFAAKMCVYKIKPIFDEFEKKSKMIKQKVNDEIAPQFGRF
eukprot:399168_1